MDQAQFDIELLSFDEKISLSQLEESKATERTRELQYQKSRFMIECLKASLKAQQPQPQPK